MGISRIVKNLIHKLNAWIAVIFYGYPARDITVIGVTGTDGKTTTASLISHTLNKSGKKVLLISTVGLKMSDEQSPVGLHVTTPDAWFIQKHLRRAVNAGCQYAVIEMTSHGLDQGRTIGTKVEIGVLTNITPEHLDYHITMKNYTKAKAKMFADSKYIIFSKKQLEYPIEEFLRRDIKKIDYNDIGVSKTVNRAIRKYFPQKYNQFNAKAAYAVLRILEVPENIISLAFSTFPSVSGRLNEIKNNKGFRIFVDFAHTPNSMVQLLKYLRTITKKRLIVVFGCAGKRDKIKRPKMGNIAARLSDIVILTREDNRSESIKSINKAIRSGFPKKMTSQVYEIDDRSEAIKQTIQKIAKKGDLVVFCGKGHEESLNIDGIEKPWNERKKIEEALI